MSDPRVIAIRDDNLVGAGSCSYVDECMTDQELLEALNDSHIQGTENSIRWALDTEQLHLEQGLNARWGEDDDPQKLSYDEFMQCVQARERTGPPPQRPAPNPWLGA